MRRWHGSSWMTWVWNLEQTMQKRRGHLSSMVPVLGVVAPPHSQTPFTPPPTFAYNGALNPTVSLMVTLPRADGKQGAVKPQTAPWPVTARTVTLDWNLVIKSQHGHLCRGTLSGGTLFPPLTSPLRVQEGEKEVREVVVGGRRWAVKSPGAPLTVRSRNPSPRLSCKATGEAGRGFCFHFHLICPNENGNYGAVIPPPCFRDAVPCTFTIPIWKITHKSIRLARIVHGNWQCHPLCKGEKFTLGYQC